MSIGPYSSRLGATLGSTLGADRGCCCSGCVDRCINMAVSIGAFSAESKFRYVGGGGEGSPSCSFSRYAGSAGVNCEGVQWTTTPAMWRCGDAPRKLGYRLVTSLLSAESDSGQIIGGGCTCYSEELPSWITATDTGLDTGDGLSVETSVDGTQWRFRFDSSWSRPGKSMAADPHGTAHNHYAPAARFEGLSNWYSTSTLPPLPFTVSFGTSLVIDGNASGHEDYCYPYDVNGPTIWFEQEWAISGTGPSVSVTIHEAPICCINPWPAAAAIYGMPSCVIRDFNTNAFDGLRVFDPVTRKATVWTNPTSCNERVPLDDWCVSSAYLELSYGVTTDQNGGRAWIVRLMLDVLNSDATNDQVAIAEYHSVVDEEEVPCALDTDETIFVYDPDTVDWVYYEAFDCPGLAGACCDTIREAVPGTPGIITLENPCAYGMRASFGGAPSGRFCDYMDTTSTVAAAELTRHSASNPPAIQMPECNGLVASREYALSEDTSYRVTVTKLGTAEDDLANYQVKVELLAIDADTRQPATWELAVATTGNGWRCPPKAGCPTYIWDPPMAAPDGTWIMIVWDSTFPGFETLDLQLRPVRASGGIV